MKLAIWLIITILFLLGVVVGCTWRYKFIHPEKSDQEILLDVIEGKFFEI